MSFFKNFDWSGKSIAKVIGLALLGVAGLSVVIALISFSFRTVFQGPSYNEASYDYAVDSGGYGIAESKMALSSTSRIGIPVPAPDYSTGDDAENYEVKTYSATVKTRKLERDCKVISDMKTRDDIIFENSNQNDNSCYFSFKVKKAAESEVLKTIEGLKPDDLNQNIQTIKGTIEEYDSQLDILNKKLTALETTLSDAQNAYDSVAVLATNKQDVESLATIIDNKLKLIDKLTTERLDIKQQIDNYLKNKADQMERLNYTFFNVSIYKDLIFDWKEIKDSWKYELKAFVQNFNEVIQGISVNLVTYMIRFIQVAIYFFLSVFLLKFVWIAVKRIWKGKKKK